METQALTIAQHLQLSPEEISFLEQTKLRSRTIVAEYLKREANLSGQHATGEEVCHEQV